MKLPQTPPDDLALLSGLHPERLVQIFAGSKGLDEKGRYLHWDELRHRSHPKLSPEEHWLQVKLARRAGYRSLPLRDKQGSAFVYSLPDPLLRGLHGLDQHLGGALDADPALVNGATRDRYVLSSLIEESISSSVLEGASTTRRVAREMLEKGRRPRDKSERMIFNNYQAMRFVREHRNEALSPELVLELHRIVTGETLDDPATAGRLRRGKQDDVDIVTQEGLVLHTPPSHEELPQRLEQLCAFANDTKGEAFVHPVLRAMLVHFQLAYDHPFVDGNGRTARILFYFCMARYGYWLAEFLSISGIILKAPVQYGRAFLYTETDANDTTYFLLHQLDVVEKAYEALLGFLRERRANLDRVEERLRQDKDLRNRLNHRQLDLIRHALAHPNHVYTIEEHRIRQNVVYQSARSDLLGLAELGLFEQFKRGRAYHFAATADLETRLSGQLR